MVSAVCRAPEHNIALKSEIIAQLYRTRISRGYLGGIWCDYSFMLLSVYVLFINKAFLQIWFIVTVSRWWWWWCACCVTVFVWTVDILTCAQTSRWKQCTKIREEEGRVWFLTCLRCRTSRIVTNLLLSRPILLSLYTPKMYGFKIKRYIRWPFIS